LANSLVEQEKKGIAHCIPLALYSRYRFVTIITQQGVKFTAFDNKNNFVDLTAASKHQQCIVHHKTSTIARVAFKLAK